MCMGGGGSSAPATTPLPSQEAGNPNNGQTAIVNAPTTTTVDTSTTDSTLQDKGVSSLRIKRNKGGGGTGTGSSGTGLNIPT